MCLGSVYTQGFYQYTKMNSGYGTQYDILILEYTSTL